MRFKVLHSRWAGDDEVFAGGEHEVEKPTKAFLRLVAAGAAAGALELLDDTDLSGHVESDEVSTAKLEKAQADGTWRRGNLEQFILDRADRLAYDATLADDHGHKLSAARREQYEREHQQARDALTALEDS